MKPCTHTFTKPHCITFLLTIMTILLLGGWLLLPSASADDVVETSVHLAPDRIVLNALGKADNYHVVIPMPLPTGFRLGDEFQVLLIVDDQVIAEAVAFRYCYVDDNFLADFDRTTVYTSPTIIENADSTVEAVVAGCYTAYSQTETIEVCFSGSDELTIHAPGK